MITLPASPAVQHVNEDELDFGLFQRPGLGAPATRVDRLGNRITAELQLPPMPADEARVFAVRIKQGKSEGLRVPWPLMGIDQGNPGSPVVNGSGAGGTSLPVRGVTPGYTFKEGWWLNAVDSAGAFFLHQAKATTVFAGGTGTLSVWPPLRADLSDGNLLVMDEPMIEGWVTSHSPFPRPTDHNVTLSFTLEEMQ